MATSMGSKRWGRRWDPASNDALEGLLFVGAPALLRQLDDLVLRPRRWGETLLPIIYLVCAPTVENGSTPTNPLDGLADRLRHARGVLHSRINGQAAPPTDSDQSSENSVRRFLDGVVADLSQRRGLVPSLRFPHYSLAVWLANLFVGRVAPHEHDQAGRRVDAALKKFFEESSLIYNMTTRAETRLIDEFPRWVQVPVRLLPHLGLLLMRAFWRPPKWVTRSRIASKHSSGSFRRLAQKLMEQGLGEHQHNIHQDEVDHLLVDAFMEDLRRAYRHTTLFGIGRVRTAYPVLLIDIDKIGSAAADLRLLKLISDSRAEYLRKNTAGPGRQPPRRAYFHPLLIIAHGDSSALDKIGLSNYLPMDHHSRSAADIKYYYNQWYKALANSDSTWFIPLRVPIEPVPQGLRAELTEEIPLPHAPYPVMTSVAAALLVVTASVIGYDIGYTNCGTWYWEPQLQRQVLTTDRNQCVGLAPSGYRFFDDVSDVNGMDQELANDLREVEDRIHRTNELAVKDPEYLTVVYLSQITPGDIANYRSELAQLRGIAVAQEGSLADRPVRVLLANGGDRMDYGKVAAEAIAREASKDDTLVAVVGLGVSRTGTRDAIIRLALPDARIPTIGAILSDTDLATNTSPYYHQVGPTNQREAEVGAFYATTHLGARNVTIYYAGDRNDLYSTDLKERAKRAFEARGLAVREQAYRINPNDDGGDISLVGREACNVGPEGVVFYTGRSEQLSVFLKGMQSRCEGNYPHFLGGDAVSVFVLDGGLNEFPGLTVDYLPQASSLFWGPECKGADSVGFFVVYRKLFGEGACPSARDASSILAYDALQVFIQGVRNAGVPRPSPDAVLAGIEDISSEGPGPLRGVSGQIDYPRTGDQGIPKDKAILVLRGRAAAEPQRMLLCGQHDTAQPPPDNCSAPLGR